MQNYVTQVPVKTAPLDFVDKKASDEVKRTESKGFMVIVPVLEVIGLSIRSELCQSSQVLN